MTLSVAAEAQALITSVKKMLKHPSGSTRSEQIQTVGCDQKESVHCSNIPEWDADREGEQQMQPSEIAAKACVRPPINKSGAGTTQKCEVISRKLLPLYC